MDEPKVDLKEELKEVDEGKVEPIITENKIVNFDGIKHLTVELEGNRLFLYSSKNSILFACSVSNFTEEFNEENIKKTKIIFHDKFHKNSKGEKVNSVFSFEDIEGFLQNINDNNSCVLKNIFEDGKFITFKSCDEYYCYDVINDYVFRLYDFNTNTNTTLKNNAEKAKHYFIVDNSFPMFSYYFYTLNNKYGYSNFGKGEYKISSSEEEENNVKNEIYKYHFLKESK